MQKYIIMKLKCEIMLSRTKKILMAFCLSVVLLSQGPSISVLGDTMQPPM